MKKVVLAALLALAIPVAATAQNNAGPNLPWPCWMVRLGAGGKTNAELAAEGKSRGIKLSKKQERQALACLGRR